MQKLHAKVAVQTSISFLQLYMCLSRATCQQINFGADVFLCGVHFSTSPTRRLTEASTYLSWSYTSISSSWKSECKEQNMHTGFLLTYSQDLGRTNMFQISEFRCSYGDLRVLTFCFGNSACHTIDIKGDKRIFKRTVLSWLLQPSFIQIVHV